MRYFGQNSLSTWIHRVLKGSWYLVIVGYVGLSLLLAIAFFPNLGGPVTQQISQQICASGQQDPEWQTFMATPLVCKAFVFPYLALITFLLLKILKQSESLFDNFRRNAIFTKDNATNLSKLSKWVIGFSLVTFNFSALLMSLILLLLCEIFKNGSALQEEHDLTV